MPKYTITIQQVVDVEAKDEKTACALTKENPPQSFLFGAGPDGGYSVDTRKAIKIISCEPKQKRSRKNA